MNYTNTIRKTLELHRIRSDQGGLAQKCSGCPWIGWSHDRHLAEAIDEAIARHQGANTHLLPQKPQPLIIELGINDPLTRAVVNASSENHRIVLTLGIFDPANDERLDARHFMITGWDAYDAPTRKGEPFVRMKFADIDEPPTPPV